MKLSITGERVWNKNYNASNKFIVKNIFSDDMSYRYLFGKNVDAANQEKIMFLQYDPLGNLKNAIGYNPHDTLTLSFATDFVGAYVADLAGNNKKVFSTSNVNRINRGSDVRINSFSGNVIVTNISSGTETADKFSLSQNYPNPFNPKTTIRFSLPSEGFAKLIVYDINGREVSTLVNENLTNGVYDKNFDGANLASGIYFYKLEFTGFNGQKFVEQKKFILIK
ncbi:MAG: T9SS type A sorting domain-containing protein [Bacteroidetes bacterium]|nr:T9SS type A sorting domain-containing protein [Bacteroidota bacterium]